MKNGKLQHDPLLNQLIGQYVQTRAELKKCKESYEEFIKDRVEMMHKLEGSIMSFLDDNGLESVKTNEGTAYTRNVSTAKLEDPDAFIDFVAANNAFELMDRRANAPACREYAQQHGSLPPGVHLNNVRTIGVRSPTDK